MLPLSLLFDVDLDDILTQIEACKKFPDSRYNLLPGWPVDLREQASIINKREWRNWQTRWT